LTDLQDWQCVIRRDDTAGVVIRHDAKNKETAHALSLLEISRLKLSQDPLRNASKPRSEALVHVL
jgi:hypothetical protein